MDYRDPRNGPEVVRALAVIDHRAAELGAALAELADLLRPDVELTPDQSKDLADTLATIGLFGGGILALDLSRTRRRESSS
jgi:hypothetical protein